MSAQSFNIILHNIYLLGDLYDSFSAKKSNLVSSRQGVVGEKTQNIVVNATSANQGTVLTIFQYADDVFTRINTSVKDENGNYAIGTTLTNQTIIDSLLEGKVWYGTTSIFGEDYIAMYAPIYDSNNNLLIGSKFAGIKL